MIIFSSTIQRRMTPAGGQPPVQPASTTTPAPVVRKKFQVVPVPGEFSRGRWKCVDTRGHSTNGVFGNYPPGEEYKTIVTYKNNIITVRKKFCRVVPQSLDQERELSPVESHITVVSSTDRVCDEPEEVYDPNFVPPEQIEVIIMSPPRPIVQQQPTPSPVAGASASSGAAQHSSTVIISSQQTHITPNPVVMGNTPTSNYTVTTQVPAPKEEEEASKIATNTSNTVVAIDNKIVQAMDLVKTHLTFAVREEVENLRSTISDLESKLITLREENRILRDNVSPEVLAFITANNHLCMFD